MSYSTIERKIAKALDRFPHLRRGAKWAYQRLAYLISPKGDQFQLHPGCQMRTVAGEELTKVANFFGYFDKTPWSLTDRYYLNNFLQDHDTLGLAIHDLQCGSYKVVATTKAWNFQQGAMAGWLGENQIFFNDVVGDRLVGKILSLRFPETTRVISLPFQSVNQVGSEALTLNYKRLDRIRPEYGYKAPVENFSPWQSDAEDGIWRLNLLTNESRLIISLEALKHLRPKPEMANAQHKVNHLLYNPSGQRFAFMHRWLGPKGKFSRLYTADSRDGTDLYCLADERLVSHYTWLDDDHLLAWARKDPWGDRYYLFKDRSREIKIIGADILDRYGDGHPNFSPCRRWLITDTYPDKSRMRHLLLFNLATQQLIVVGKFFAPWIYDGPQRCDLHPRWNHRGDQISIDSVHDGLRRSYIIDVSKLVREG